MSKIYQKKNRSIKNRVKGRLGGFTLIELLVVVLIIGILAGVALPQYEVAVEKSRAGSVLPVLSAIDNAQQAFFAANGRWAQEFDELDVALPSGTTVSDGGWATGSNGIRYLLCHDCNDSIRAYPSRALPYYVEFYPAGSRICWAENNHTRANKICKGVAGKDFSNKDENNTGYRLN